MNDGCLSRIGGAMLKLTNNQRWDDEDEIRDSIPFPVEAARYLKRGNRWESAPTDSGTCDAARRVERALREVERHFGRLRLIAGDPDPDLPRAA